MKSFTGKRYFWWCGFVAGSRGRQTPGMHLARKSWPDYAKQQWVAGWFHGLSWRIAMQNADYGALTESEAITLLIDRDRRREPGSYFFSSYDSKYITPRRGVNNDGYLF